MSLIENIGAKTFNPWDLSYCKVRVFRDLYFSTGNIEELLAQSIADEAL